ncbi:hypothetical protein ACH5RR_011326 [Cinchona calisaya]|uniref:Protein FLX-like 2 n=1 Tax=Cinchona calisaya TaxID=153742 RepID=A0ABD3A4J5_9GENT
MGSKDRIPLPHIRHPLPGPGMVHPDPFGPMIRPPPGGFSPFDMIPPPGIMEQKLAPQHVEKQKLAAENQMLAATHGTLREELAAAQHELQMLHAHIGDMKSEKELQTRVFKDKIARMEAELQAADSIKMELQQARAEAQILVAGRQELISKVQQLNQDLQRAYSDVKQIPFLLSQLDGLRLEYQRCRATYDYEKKLCSDHLESLQVMEKNYQTMAREVEKLQAELTNSSQFDRRTGAFYGGNTGYSESNASGNYPVGQNAYGVSQARGPLSGGGSGAAADAGAAAGGGGGGEGSGAATPVGIHSGTGIAPVTARAAYDAARVPGFDSHRGPAGAIYDVHKGIGGPRYDAQRGDPAPGYETHRLPGYDAGRTPLDGHGASPLYDSHRGSSYDVQRGVHNPPKNVKSGASSRATGSQGQVAPMSTASYYGSATPPARGAGMGYEVPPRGGNAVRR